MGLNSQIYIPCLRWKQGEYQALFTLSPIARNSIMPLIEIAEIGFDFETQTASKTIDEHLLNFAKRVKEKWGRKECFIDSRYIESSKFISSGQDTTVYIFNELRSMGISAIPVVALQNYQRYKDVITQVITADNRGLCLRVNIEDAIKGDFDRVINNILKCYGLAKEQCDLIIDLGAPNFKPIQGFADLLLSIIKSLPNLDLWRSFVILSTSFPPSLSGLKPGSSIISRDEWLLYKILATNLREAGLRVPNFSDYGIAHPDLLQVDMRIVKPNASVRYTINDNWLIAKGQNVRKYGYDQYKYLCGLIVNSSYFYGEPFSEGDKYIYRCARGEISTGNLSTWRKIGTNHHIEMVVRDIANFAVS